MTWRSTFTAPGFRARACSASTLVLHQLGEVRSMTLMTAIPAINEMINPMSVAVLLMIPTQLPSQFAPWGWTLFVAPVAYAQKPEMGAIAEGCPCPAPARALSGGQRWGGRKR